MASSDWLKIPYDAAWRLVMKDEGLELSGYIAFTAFFSLFPFLIFLAALAGFLGDRETADEFNAAMFEFMPRRTSPETLAPAVREVIGSRQGGLLTIGILTTLWFASNGIEALRTGLNRAYGVSEERPIWWLRLQSIAFVIVGALIIFFLSLAVLLGPLIWRVLGPAIDDVLATEVVFVSARYVVAIFLLWGALMLLHRWLPNTKQAYSRVLPGVCVSTRAVAGDGQPVLLVHRQPRRLQRVLRQPRRGGDHADVLLRQRGDLHLRRRDQRRLARPHRPPPRPAGRERRGRGEGRLSRPRARRVARSALRNLAAAVM